MDYTGMNMQPNKDDDKEHLTWKKFLKMGFHVWRQFDDPYYAGFAAQLAYFFFMSAIPTLIVLTQMLGIFDVSMDFIEDWLNDHLSTQMNTFLKGLFSASSTAFANILMIILALWASSALVFSLSRLCTYIISNGKYRFAWFQERFKAILLALITMTVIAAVLIVYVYGETIARRIVRSPFRANLISDIKTPVLALIFFAIILANYYVLPRIRVPVAAVMPGAVVATIGITIVTMLYSLYTSRSGNYNILYGAFSNIVAMLLWFYLLSWVLCIGMMFNRSWDIMLKRDRLSPEKLRTYIISQYGKNGEEMYNRLIKAEHDMLDDSMDTLAVRMSRRFDPGYDEKRERELMKKRQTQELTVLAEEMIAESEELKDETEK